MRGVGTMLNELNELVSRHRNIPVSTHVTQYVNLLSSDEICFALEGIPFQELADFINQCQIAELCCGFHYSQWLLKCFLLLGLLANVLDPELSIPDGGSYTPSVIQGVIGRGNL